MFLTLESFAMVCNVVAVAVVVGLSLSAQKHFNKRIFRPWIWAHVFELVSITAEVHAQMAGRQPGIVAYQALACILSLWFLVQTGLALHNRAHSRRTFALVVGPASVLVLGAVAAGVPFVILSTVVVIPITVALMWLGISLFRHSDVDRSFTLTWLTLPLVLRGLSLYAFPWAAAHNVTWAFEAVSALLHGFAGMGMVLYLARCAQDQIERQNRELLRLDAMKNDFLGAVSHELRTPLTCIQGAAALLVQERLDEDALKSLHGIIEKNSRRLGRLVDDLLDYTRMENGMFRVKRQEEDLNGVAVGACESFATEAEAKNLLLVCDPASEPLWVDIDAGRVRQALENLLANAVKFTASGGRVRVWTQRTVEAACVHVQDTGTGIPPEHHEAIFTKFFQIDNSSTRAADGAGLGLAIARYIAETGHGGRITLTSTPGAGSTFTLWLPLSVAADAPKQAAAPNASAPALPHGSAL